MSLQQQPLRVITQQDKNRPKEIISTFFLTINTNSQDVEKNDLLRVYQMFYNNIMQYITYRYTHTQEQRQEQQNKVHGVSSDVAIERGKKFKRVHLHAIVKLNHNTNLSLNYNLIRQLFIDELQLPGVHVDCKFIRESTMSLKEYLRKNPLVE